MQSISHRRSCQCTSTIHSIVTGFKQMKKPSLIENLIAKKANTLSIKRKIYVQRPRLSENIFSRNYCDVILLLIITSNFCWRAILFQAFNSNKNTTHLRPKRSNLTFLLVIFELFHALFTVA